MNFFLRLAPPVLIAIVAGLLRLLSWHSVFQEGGVYPNGNDAYYHLQRIRYSVEHFPDVLRFDPLMNFPAGAQSIWPPTFDWLMAALLLSLPGVEEPDQLERYAVCVPPIIGVGTILIVYFLGLRFFSRTVAIAAALSMAILPAHSLYSRVGAVDHHVLVATVVAIMLALAMALFREEPGGDQSGDSGGEREVARKRVRLSVGLGLSMAIAVLVWPGSLLQVGVLQVALVIRLLSAKDIVSAKLWALRFALVHFVAFLAVAPMSLGNTWQLWGPFSPVVLTNFQPMYFLAASVCFGTLGGMWRLGWGVATRQSRMLSAGLLGGGLVLGLLLAIPDLLGAISEALSWFAKDEEFQSAVNESVALFGGDRGQTRAATFLGRFVYVVPLVIGFFVWQMRRRAEVLLLLGWALVLYVATLVQWRFMNSYSIAHCLLIGLVVESLFRGVMPRLVSPLRRILAAVAAIIVLVIVFTPPLQSYRMHLENFERSLRGISTVPIGAQRQARLVADAARFLRDRSSRRESPGGVADFSVLGPWGDGHILKAIGGLAVVQDNFGDDVAPENFARADEYFAARTEALALEILSPMKTRYVLVRSTGSGHAKKSYYYKSLFSRLYRLRGNRGTLPKIPEHDTKVKTPLVHHRLIYQSPRLRAKDPQPYLMIFEIVAGAELVGRATPHSTVNVKLDIAPQQGSRFLYNDSTKADANGVYRFRLPYSNESSNEPSNETSSPNVRVGRQYVVRVGAQRAGAVLPESAILSGAVVEGPVFRN